MTIDRKLGFGWQSRVLIAVASVSALQPRLTGALALVTVVIFAHLFSVARPKVITLAFVIGLMLFSSVLVNFNLSPALAFSLLALVSLALLPGAEGLRIPLVGWVCAISFALLPWTGWVSVELANSVPAWMGAIVTPCFFLVVASLMRALSYRLGTMAVLVELLVGQAMYRLEVDPAVQTVASLLPVVVSQLIPIRKPHRSVWPLVFSALMIHCISLWVLVPSLSVPSRLAFWVPTSPSLATPYFENYESILRAVGFRNFKMVRSASELAPNEWIIFPNGMHPDLARDLKALRDLPYYKTLRVFVVGEHTDAGGVATALESSGAPVHLNRDTTIPPGNANLIGWSSGQGVTLPRTMALNRGASVGDGARMAIPLVWVQGGHRETDNFVDGRLGDMTFRVGERVGLYSVLSLGREDGGPTWVVLGDSTPFLNEFLVSDPQGVASIFALSSGIPAFLSVFGWMALVITAALRVYSARISALIVATLVITLVACSSEYLASQIRDRDASKLAIANRGLYGDEAVGRALVAISPSLVKSDFKIEIGQITTQLSGKRISIGHPREWMARSDCARAGNITVNSLRLLDVLACPDDTLDAVVMVGSDTVIYRGRTNLVVLDQHFLANSAPKENQRFLMEWMEANID